MLFVCRDNNIRVSSSAAVSENVPCIIPQKAQLVTVCVHTVCRLTAKYNQRCSVHLHCILKSYSRYVIYTDPGVVVVPRYRPLIQPCVCTMSVSVCTMSVRTLQLQMAMSSVGCSRHLFQAPVAITNHRRTITDRHTAYKALYSFHQGLFIGSFTL